MSSKQRILSYLNELRRSNVPDVRNSNIHGTPIALAVMRSQILGEIVRRITHSRSMANHNDFSTQRHCFANALIVFECFRRIAYARQLFVNEVVQQVMGIVWPYNISRSIVGCDIDLEDLGAMAIQNDDEIKSGGHGVLGRLRWDGIGPSGLHKKLMQHEFF